MAKKFYEEFNKKTTPEHDQLVLQCTSEEGLLTIIREVLKENWKRIGRESYRVTFYRCGEPTWCTLQQLVMTNYFEYYNFSSCRECRFFNKKTNVGSGLFFPRPREEGVFYITIEYEVSSTECTSYETEVICKTSSGFIIGYADLIAYYRVKGQRTAVSCHFEENYPNIPCHVFGGNEIIRNIAVLVEVKPELESLGTIIRQVKTYYDALECKIKYRRGNTVFLKAVVTYSDFTASSRRLFANEGITLIRFPKPNVRKKKQPVERKGTLDYFLIEAIKRGNGETRTP